MSHPAVGHRRSDLVSILTKQVWAVETIKATTSVKTACIGMCFGSDYVGDIHQHATFECRPVVAAASCESTPGNRILAVIQTDLLIRRQGEQWLCEHRKTNWAFENDCFIGHWFAQDFTENLVSAVKAVNRQFTTGGTSSRQQPTFPIAAAGSNYERKAELIADSRTDNWSRGRELNSRPADYELRSLTPTP